MLLKAVNQTFMLKEYKKLITLTLIQKTNNILGTRWSLEAARSNL